MTPPRTPLPDYESDEIVDMTPADTPAVSDPAAPSDTATDDVVDMAPAYSPLVENAESMDMTPAYSPDSESDKPVDVSPTSSLKGSELDETIMMASPRTPDRKLSEHRAAPPLRKPEHTAEEHEEHGGERPQPVRRRWKRAVPALLAVALLLLAGNKVFGHALGLGALNLTGGSIGAAQSTATPVVANTPTPKPAQIGNAQLSTTVGPLIVLNPGVVRQGTQVTVTGSGFDASAAVDLTIRRPGSTAALASTFVQADKGGTFSGAALSVPMSLGSGNFVIVANERNSKLTAQAIGTVAGGAPTVKLGLQVGKPGDTVVLALHGFAPSETIKVYWNTLSGQPLTTFQADSGGNVGQAKLQVPVGAVGNNTFLFVGAKSQSLVAANFLVLQLYPTVKLSSYALQAGNLLSFTGSGFGPGERVFIYLNNSSGQPLAVVPTDNTGAFKNAPGFVVPFVLKGKQTLIFMGEQSRAPDTVSFTVEPYAPSVQPSTYGGFPGTTIAFYVSGFARDEVVHVYAGHTKSSMGTMVSCFQTNDHGSAGAAGSYLIPGNAQGTLGFALVGGKSGGVGTATVNVTAPPAPVQTSPQQPFTCPLDQQNQQTQTPGSGASASQPSQQASPATTPSSTSSNAP